MKLLSITLFAALLCFCGPEDGMSGEDGGQGPQGVPGPQGPAGPQGPPGISGEHDGNRIKARYITTTDGYKMVYGLWDSQKKEPCYWIQVDDKFLCLPSFISWIYHNNDNFHFSDFGCTAFVYAPKNEQDLDQCSSIGSIHYMIGSLNSTIPNYCAYPNSQYFFRISTKTEFIFLLGPIQKATGPGFQLYDYDIASHSCRPGITTKAYYPLLKANFFEFAEQ